LTVTFSVNAAVTGVPPSEKDGVIVTETTSPALMPSAAPS
jgi:hypothetical protein